MLITLSFKGITLIVDCYMAFFNWLALKCFIVEQPWFEAFLVEYCVYVSIHSISIKIIYCVAKWFSLLLKKLKFFRHN